MKALVPALLIIAACDGASGVSVTLVAGADPPAYGDAPFPTDAVKDGDRIGPIAGFETLVSSHADLVTAHVAALDGFGLRPLVEFFVDGPLDAASVPATTSERAAAAALIDIDPASPERGRVVVMDWRYDAERGVVAGAPHPGQMLREGTRYAAIVTDAIRDADGASLHASDDLASLSGYPRWQATADALAELDPDGHVAGIAVFTTQHASAPLIAARTALEAAPPPILAFPDPDVIFRGKTELDRVLGTATRATHGPRKGLERWGNGNPTGIAHDHVGVIGSGTITVVRFRGDDTGTNLAEDETFQLGADGAPAPVAVEEIPITFVLPAAPPPAAGYPVVIHGHGLGSSRDALLAFAEPFTAQGFAIVGIDMAGHGSRFDPTDEINNASSWVPDFTGVAAMRDGFGDSTGLASTFDFFEGFLNVSAVRDSIRQSALDLSRVVQLLRRSDLDLSPLRRNVRLDTRRIAYTGESFGTVVGTVFAAIEPDVDLYILDVPGGGILDQILPNSAEIGALALPFIDTVYLPMHQLDRWHPLIGLMQAVIDGADPLTYAPHVLRDRFAIAGETLGPRSVVAIEVLGDQVLSNRGTDALAQGLGLDVLAPHLEAPAGLASIEAPAAGNRDGQTAILVQYSPATHGANWSNETGTLSYMPNFPADGPVPFPKLPEPITIPNPIYDTHDQVAVILRTHLRGEAPRVEMTRPPVPDFDADGVLDADDAAPYDPDVH